MDGAIDESDGVFFIPPRYIPLSEAIVNNTVIMLTGPCGSGMHLPFYGFFILFKIVTKSGGERTTC